MPLFVQERRCGGHRTAAAAAALGALLASYTAADGRTSVCGGDAPLLPRQTQSWVTCRDEPQVGRRACQTWWRHWRQPPQLPPFAAAVLIPLLCPGLAGSWPWQARDRRLREHRAPGQPCHSLP